MPAPEYRGKRLIARGRSYHKAAALILIILQSYRYFVIEFTTADYCHVIFLGTFKLQIILGKGTVRGLRRLKRSRLKHIIGYDLRAFRFKSAVGSRFRSVFTFCSAGCEKQCCTGNGKYPFFILTSVTPLNSQGSSHWRQELHLNISYPPLPP